MPPRLRKRSKRHHIYMMSRMSRENLLVSSSLVRNKIHDQDEAGTRDGNARRMMGSEAF